MHDAAWTIARIATMRTDGTLEPGKQASFVLWDIGSPAELAYAIGANPRIATVQAGRAATM